MHSEASLVFFSVGESESSARSLGGAAAVTEPTPLSRLRNAGGMYLPGLAAVTLARAAAAVVGNKMAAFASIEPDGPPTNVAAAEGLSAANGIASFGF